jgi:hypothetical protein
MSKSLKTFLILGAILIIAFTALAYFSPKKVDWRPTYNTMDKIPMGLYILDREIDSLFGTWVDRVKYPLNEHFYEGVFEDGTFDNHILLYINQENHWNTSDIENICTFVAQGNTAFISSIQLPEILKDSLGLNVYAVMFDPMYRKFNDTINIRINDSISAKIEDKNGLTGSYFVDYDSLRTTVLGFVALDSVSMPNFLKIKHGSGHFLIHLEPAVFTNYHLLKKEHHRYAERAFYHIPAHNDIIWSLNDQTSKVISDSPLRFILSQPALKWAWYLLLAGIGMFVLFNIRRSQRIIPIIPKPTNTSVEFVKTIGNLYFLEGDIKSMMDKKIVYLLANIRSEFHLTTEVLDDKFIHLLHVKSGKDEKIVNKMIFLVNKHKEHDYNCTLDDINRLNTSIEAFYQS